jgi:glycerol-3-phosphate cytidylyltransferase
MPINGSSANKIVGFTCSCFDLFHAGHVAMLEEVSKHCDHLIVGLQIDPTIDRPEKNKPVQTLIERQIQVRGCKYVDEIIVYETEKDLKTILKTLPIDVRFVGQEYALEGFTGQKICKKKRIKILYNTRMHDFSSSELRKRIKDAKQI